jgi:glycosyltransferase involved in cell wall biosynthesis
VRLRQDEVAVVVPAFQAARSVGDIVTRCLQQTPHVVVVDDGSTDGTSEIAVSAGARVIRLGRNFGKGKALRTAFYELFPRGFPAIVTVDADGQHLPEEIPKLIRTLAESSADLVLGTREQLWNEMSAVRRTSNRISSWAIAKVAGMKLIDTQTGFRLYTERLIVRTGFPESRFEAESAVLVRASRLGFRIATVPVRLGFVDGRCTSHFRPLLDSLRIAGAVTKARLGSL